MNEELLHLVRERTESEGFRAFVGHLLERRAEYEALKARNNEIGKDFRAKREGITVQQIEAESSKTVARYALRDDEKKRISDERRRRVWTFKDDAQLLRMILSSNQLELGQQERSRLRWKKLPTENKPLKQE